MYGSKNIIYRNVYLFRKNKQMWNSKNRSYEIPYTVIGSIKFAGL